MYNKSKKWGKTMDSKILIVDDNKEIREVISILLTGEGYGIEEAKDGAQAIQKVKDNCFDLIILDVMMPNVNGYQACVEIRKESNAPILFLSAKSQEGDKTLGFSSGGDDYLAKPFSYNELLARVKALTRRYQVYKGKEIEQDKQWTIHGLTIDEQEEKVYRNDTLLDITDLEYAILMLLVKNRKQIFSAQQLYETIWNEEYYYGANNTIMVHIRNLRKKVEEDAQNPKIVKTIWGKGYRCD